MEIAISKLENASVTRNILGRLVIRRSVRMIVLVMDFVGKVAVYALKDSLGLIVQIRIALPIALETEYAQKESAIAIWDSQENSAKTSDVQTNAVTMESVLPKENAFVTEDSGQEIVQEKFALQNAQVTEYVLEENVSVILHSTEKTAQEFLAQTDAPTTECVMKENATVLMGFLDSPVKSLYAKTIALIMVTAFLQKNVNASLLGQEKIAIRDSC